MYARSGQINTMNELAVIMRSLGIMAIPAVEFQERDTKLGWFLAKSTVVK